MMFKKGTKNFSISDPTYTIPVVRTRNTDSSATVKWRTKKAQRFELSGPLKFMPGETEKNIVIDPRSHPGPVQPETIQLELFDPSSNATIGDRKTTLVNVIDGGGKKCHSLQKHWNVVSGIVVFQISCDERREHSKEEGLCVVNVSFILSPLPVHLKSPEIAQMQQMGYVNPKSMSPGGRLPASMNLAPANLQAKATGPRNIHLNWDPAAGNPMGYKVQIKSTC